MTDTALDTKLTDTPQILLAHHLKALKLPTFLREYDRQAQLCAAEGVDHPRYLMRLAELEMVDREPRMVERRIERFNRRNPLSIFATLVSIHTFTSSDVGIMLWLSEPQQALGVPASST